MAERIHRVEELRGNEEEEVGEVQNIKGKRGMKREFEEMRPHASQFHCRCDGIGFLAVNSSFFFLWIYFFPPFFSNL